jgi:hypothetical protein
MNLFILMWCARQSASLMCDMHVPKMLLECTQMIYTVWQLLGRTPKHIGHTPLGAADETSLTAYKPTHQYHCVVQWAASCAAHYAWLLKHAQALAREYTARYGKSHASTKHVEAFADQDGPFPAPVKQESPSADRLPAPATKESFFPDPGCLPAPTTIPVPNPQTRRGAPTSTPKPKKRRRTEAALRKRWQHVSMRTMKRAWKGNPHLPTDWEYWDCAIEDDVFFKVKRYGADGQLDPFATYQCYYEHKRKQWKAEKESKQMRWYKQPIQDGLCFSLGWMHHANPRAPPQDAPDLAPRKRARDSPPASANRAKRARFIERPSPFIDVGKPSAGIEVTDDWWLGTV